MVALRKHKQDVFALKARTKKNSCFVDTELVGVLLWEDFLLLHVDTSAVRSEHRLITRRQTAAACVYCQSNVMQTQHDHKQGFIIIKADCDRA